MISLSQYVWIYSLAEALALTLIVAVVFGVKWWRLRQRQHRMRQAMQQISALIETEIDVIEARESGHSAVDEALIVCLDTLADPFREDAALDDARWPEVIETFKTAFAQLAGSTSKAPSSEPTGAVQSGTLAAPEHVEDAHFANIDTRLDELTSHYQVGMSALSATQASKADLKRNYQQIQALHRDIQSHLEQMSALEAGPQIQEGIATCAQINEEFMQTAFATERNYNILVNQFIGLEAHIRNLRSTINHQRTSVHKMLLERDYLAQEKKQLLKQLKASNKLVSRLNRNLETLRREYNQLYESKR